MALLNWKQFTIERRPREFTHDEQRMKRFIKLWRTKVGEFKSKRGLGRFFSGN